MTLVLESPGNLLARFCKVLEFARQWCRWQFLASNRHVSADENSHNCCHQVRFLGCRYAKNAFTFGVTPTPLGELRALLRPLASVCYYIQTLLAYDRVLEKCFWSLGKSWKSTGCFRNQESENPVTRWPDGMHNLLLTWAVRWDFKWRLKLYRDEQFLLGVGMEFYIAGEL